MTAARSGRRVFSIPPGAPFLPNFVEALLGGRLIPNFPDERDPLSLARARVFVPTRRAARALAAEIARQHKSPSVLLPRIVPLGAMDESETLGLFDIDAPFDDQPAVVSQLERRLTLARLIAAWGNAVKNAIMYVDDDRIVTTGDEPLLVAATPAQAFHLAGELAALIDELMIEGVPASKLDSLAPETFDKYWRITLDFLKIAFDMWPNHLAERGLIDRAQRQIDLVEQEIGTFERDSAASNPRIVAGSTGTNVATARLMAAIAALPAGAVVLPGLDCTLDEASAIAIDGQPRTGAPATAGHPQAALRRFLRTMGMSHRDVVEIGAPAPAVAARMEFLREALRPAETTSGWFAWRRSQSPSAMADSLRAITYVEADDERLEALAIAIAMRRVLETADETAALITPDRTLARRVRAELRRWAIDVDDSGGDPLAGEPAGVLAQLAIECARPTAGSAALLALLDHADLRVGFDHESLARLRMLAEIAVLRGADFNFHNLESQLASARSRAQEPYAHDFVKSITEQDWTALNDFFLTIKSALHPLLEMRAAHPASAWFSALRTVLQELVRAPDGKDGGESREDRDALQQAIDGFLGVDTHGFDLTIDDFAALFALIARETIVRGPRQAHPRIKILGLLEARLLNADHVALGGLDENIWPPAATTDAFLNRVMRAQLGLSSPERRIGQTAHDFIEAAGAPNLIVSRARKRDGAPTVPSRFLQRIQALAGESWEKCAEPGRELLAYARLLDEPEKSSQPVKRPTPRPALALRPTSLSITEIETWRRDPYSIYARHILKLRPFEELAAGQTAADYGTRLHDVLAAFLKKFPDGSLADDAAASLIDLASEKFAPLLADPEFRVFKWPNIATSLNEFIQWENARRENVAKIIVEASAKFPIALANGAEFVLRGRADRIDIDKDGAVTLIDFKTGKIPSKKEIADGLSPQLTLEAAMIEGGAFNDWIVPIKVKQALYVPIGRGEPIKPTEVGDPKKSFSDLVDEHLKGLKQLALQFMDQDTPYLAHPMPQFRPRYAEYDHLSRVKEWSSEAGGGEE